MQTIHFIKGKTITLETVIDSLLVPSLVLVCFSSEHHFFFLVDYVIYATYVNYDIKYLTHKLHKALFVSKYSTFPKQKVFIRPLLSISTTPTSVSLNSNSANLRHKVPQTTIGTIIIWWGRPEANPNVLIDSSSVHILPWGPFPQRVP